MAMLFQDGLVGLDPLRVLQLCVVHDLGEALGGDAGDRARRASGQSARAPRPVATGPQPGPGGASALALWDEYEAAATPEARAVKALDKMKPFCSTARATIRPISITVST